MPRLFVKVLGKTLMERNDITTPRYTREDYHIYSCPFVISFLGFSQTR